MKTFTLHGKQVTIRNDPMPGLPHTVTEKFSIGAHPENGLEWIKCALCGWVSWNQGDIIHLYCGNCNNFHQTGLPRTAASMCGKPPTGVFS